MAVMSCLVRIQFPEPNCLCFTDIIFCGIFVFMSERTPFGASEYDTTDPARLSRIDALVNQIQGLPAGKLAPSGWADEGEREERGIVPNPEWHMVPNPWEDGRPIEAAALTSEDPDDGKRDFSIVRKRQDGTPHIMASLFRPLSDRLLMMPRNPDDRFGFELIAWESDKATAFLTLAESLS
jgi:hypothetical protein